MGEDNNFENKAKRSNRAIFLLAAVVILGSGYFLVKNIFIALTYKKTVGTVLSVRTLKSSGTSNSGTTYMPTVRYSIEGGRSISRQTYVASSMYNFNKGAKITVYYDLKEPHEFYISSFLTMWALQVGGFLVGLLILKAALSLKNDKENV